MAEHSSGWKKPQEALDLLPKSRVSRLSWANFISLRSISHTNSEKERVVGSAAEPFYLKWGATWRFSNSYPSALPWNSKAITSLERKYLLYAWHGTKFFNPWQTFELDVIDFTLYASNPIKNKKSHCNCHSRLFALPRSRAKPHPKSTWQFGNFPLCFVPFIFFTATFFCHFSLP